MRFLRDRSEYANVPVLVRAALNVPIENGAVINDYRLRRAAATVRFLSERGARVVLISHIGEQGTETLSPVAQALGKLLRGVSFFPETVGPRAREAVRALPAGGILVLENLRRDKGERSNDPAFAKELAALADVFVEDSFDTCHRAHASIVGVPALLPSYAGLLLEEEIAALQKALTPGRPSLATIGGAKFSTKEVLLEKLLEQYDRVFVGGALANDFLKAAGHEIGKSAVSDADPEAIGALLKNPRLALPVDAIVVKESAFGAINAREYAQARSVQDVAPDEIILDAGPASRELLAEFVRGARTVLWNGPLGKYEAGFVDATDFLARAVANSGADSIVGGGDTIASIETLGLLPKFSFVSTGGGAMLEFLAKGTLPGIAALG